jgi:murein DD-endopeptidase MepM/ murein hydrolase activator NlpD
MEKLLNKKSYFFVRFLGLFLVGFLGLFFIKNNSYQKNYATYFPSNHIVELYNLEKQQYWSPPFIMERPMISSPYGWRAGGFHPGIDLVIKRGEPILAMFDGTIKTSTYNAGYGNFIIITHDNGLETLYAHLDARVKAGAKVKAGQLIALSGNTGWSTGAHLHLEIYHQRKALNPEWFFEFKGKINPRAQYIRLPEDISLPSGKFDSW